MFCIRFFGERLTVSGIILAKDYPQESLISFKIIGQVILYISNNEQTDKQTVITD